MLDDIRYATMTDESHAPALLAMMDALHTEDQAAFPTDRTKFPNTIRHLLAKPESGQIILFLADTQPVGYAILIPYYSNEFGGVVLFIDELFVQSNCRGRGVARRFFQQLENDRPFNAVALFLEVSPTNTQAGAFYKALGFSLRANTTLAKPLSGF